MTNDLTFPCRSQNEKIISYVTLSSTGNLLNSGTTIFFLHVSFSPLPGANFAFKSNQDFSILNSALKCLVYLSILYFHDSISMITICLPKLIYYFPYYCVHCNFISHVDHRFGHYPNIYGTDFVWYHIFLLMC